MVEKEQKEQEEREEEIRKRYGERNQRREVGGQRARRQSSRSERIRIKTLNFILVDREFRRETNSSETAFPPAKTNKT